MIGLGLALLAIGVADLVSGGLSGEPEGLGRALAGQPTAATLIVSAKSILRFPELSRRVEIESSNAPVAPVDFVTEYFLLGSLVSWPCALTPAILFAR